MKKYFYSLFSVFALSFILISCGPENEFITPIKQGINSENYAAAIIAADSAIANDPSNGQANYYKAYALSRMAAAEPNVADRKPLLVEMRENLLIAKSKFDTLESPPFESEQIGDLTIESWAREYTEGVDYLQNDSLAATVENPIDMSILHFENSLAINPDSVHPNQALAQAYYQAQNYAKAAEFQQKVINNEYYNASAYDYDRLGSFYLFVEDYPSVLTAMTAGLEVYPDSIFLIEKKADALFNTGDTDGALEVMKDLIETDPSNAQYHIVLGTQIVNRVQDLNEELTDNNDRLFELRNEDGAEAEVESLNARNEEINAESENLISEAEVSLLQATELAPTNYISFNALGILYQNRAAGLFEKRNATRDNDEAAAIDELAQAEAAKALEYYETAYELNSEDGSLCMTLFRLYTQLDIRDKSEEFSTKCN